MPTSAKRYLIPATETRTEIEVKRSRFIATAVPTFTIAEARTFIARIKTEFRDASHNVPAFLIGFGNSVTAHSNDDGEPSGTAGRPILAVLQGSGLGDIAVVVTRYFGGTKLGTGGLVRAYGNATKAVLDILPRAEKVTTHTVMLALPYNMLERVRLLVGVWNGRILNEQFTADITMTMQFTITQFPNFQEALRELSHGSLTAEIIETNEDTILPLGTYDNDVQ
ncbi:MAG: YigZ family protein [Chloroflexi bacterium]|nr:YigZ family protein [Chloroflexota bacterium]